jgi:nucleoside-diphosphate-sugar epimerase
MGRVLVAGCGYVGAALGQALAAGGHEVFGLRRRAGLVPAPLHPLAADLADRAALRRALPRGLDAVVHLAGAEARDEPAYRRAYVEGSRNLLLALADAGEAPRFLFASSTAVYGQTGGEWVDEASETRPRDFRGARLLEAEAQLSGSGLPAASVRFGGIYGPGRTRLLEAVRSGRACVQAGPPRFTNRIHRDDCAGALSHLLGLPRLAPVYIGVDREPADEAEVLRWLAARLGAPPPRVVDSGETSAAQGPPPNRRCSSRRLRESGYAFRYPSFREGYGALIEAGA